GKLVLVDDDGKPLDKVDYLVNSNSDNEVDVLKMKLQKFWNQRKLDMVQKLMETMEGYNSE
ncbi:hypothetical protein Tco_0083088, partial [Tanacetum coccineum]